MTAIYLLGKLYYDGNGVSQNYKMAAKWFKISAEKGSAKGQEKLSEMYRFGKGVPQDTVMAEMLREKVKTKLEESKNNME